jgi:hypothetical protein
MKEPQIGIEPMTARIPTSAIRRFPSENESIAIVYAGQAAGVRAQTRRTNGNEMATEKRCPRCTETLPRTAFGRRGAAGVQPYCRPCNTLNVVDWLKRPGNRERHNANIVASQSRNAEKVAARHVVTRALVAGKLVRGACEVGAECAGAVQAHHDDYGQPLAVRWLCRTHHEALHHAERAA